MKAKEQRLLFFGFSLLTMQLSILIPTYNYVCTKLAKDLASQCYRCTTLDDYEIVVADDGSTDSTSIAQNRSINDIPHCRYAESAENIGRSRILHKMVLQMQFPWVIIIDSDAEVNSENFIKTYLENDANACAEAEYLFGAGRGSKNMIFLTFGTGFGAGLILDGKLYRGTNGYAGEIGHVRLEKEGPVGYGKEGSCEGFCSGGGLAKISSKLVKEAIQEKQII